MTEDFPYPAPAAAQAVSPIDERAGLLVIADEADATNLAPVAHAAGFRLLGHSDLAAASVRLDAQTQCDAVLLFCPAQCGVLERLLVQIETQAVQTGMAVVIVAGWDTVELAYACVRNPHSQLLCDPDRTELAAALIAAGAHEPVTRQVHDINSEGNRLQQLSEEVGRLARTIDALTQRARAAAPPSFDLGPRISDRPSDYIGMPVLEPLTTGQAKPRTDLPEVTAAQVRDMLRARRMRADFLPGDLFADPAWDMLLDLLAARLEQERVSVSSLCIAAAVPPTTALRWIRKLTDEGLVKRKADPHDGRRVFITLAQDTAEALLRWFGASRRLLHG